MAEIEEQLRLRLHELQPAHDGYLRVERALAAYMREPSASSKDGGGDVGGLVVPVVLESDQPLRPVEVRAILKARGHDVAAEAVSNAMHYAVRTGKLVRLSRGLYAAPHRDGR